MFGMGFMEIFLIAIVAIIALGPEKLPDAMVQVARFFKKFKSGIEDAKSTLDNELNISDMKAEANKFKEQIEDAKSSVTNFDEFDLGVKDILNDDETKSEKKKENIALNENKTNDIKKESETPAENISNDSDKFKVKRKEKKEEDMA